MRHSARFLSLLALGAILPTAAVAQQGHRGTFVIMLGKDTMAVEQYVRVGNVVTGDLISRSGGTTINHYVLTLDKSGLPRKFELTGRRADGSPAPMRSIVATYGRDTATVVLTRDSAITRRIAASGAFPAFGNSMAVYDAVLSYLRAAGKDSADIPMLAMMAARPSSFPVVFYGAESARIWYFGAPKLVRVAKDGTIRGLSGRLTTDKIEIVASRRVNVARIAKAFAALDAAGKGLTAAPSPRDTVTASAGGAELWIDYGRPRTRGRNVFSHGVLGDTIWRSGANAATQFRTDKDLVIAGQTIPAGLYTLWTHVRPDNSAYELVFNKQTGQWGTDYDVKQDLVRVPLAVTAMSAPAEAFTIRVEPGTNGGTIMLQWASTQLSVPFTVKP